MGDMVFNYSSYKDYLNKKLAGKGKKSAFARFIGCQQSFLSQVLKGKPDLSIDHGLMANEFFEHTKDEAKHFLLLLNFGRAGSNRLREHYHAEIKLSLADQNSLAKKIDSRAKEISEHARGTYYSSWAYGAVHMLCGIHAENQIDFIARHIGLKRDELANILRFLLEQGLVVEADGRYSMAEKRIHLPATDPLILSHHKNFRLRAIEEMHALKSQNLHYSALMTISAEDAAKIRDLIFRFVEQVDKIIIPSANEAAFQLNLDMFEV